MQLLPTLLFKYLMDSVRDIRNHMKPRNYIPLGRLISDVLIESGLVDHLISYNLMEDVTVDIGKPLNARNLKSMGIIERVLVKPTLDTSWKALKDQRKIPNGLYLFSKIDPQEVIDYYLQDLAYQGVDISEFLVDWISKQPPNFMKRKREPFENSKKYKTLKLEESSTAGSPTPLNSSIPSKSLPSETPSHSNLKQLSSSLPQPSSTFTPSEPTITYPPTVEHHNSNPSSPLHDKSTSPPQHSPHLTFHL